MSPWFRWLIRLSPVRVIVLVGLAILVLSLAAYFVTDWLTQWRAVVWYDDTSVRWPRAEAQNAVTLVVVRAIALITEVTVLAVIPLLAALSAIAGWLKSRVQGTDRDQVNLLIATNTLLFLHRRVGGAFKAAATFLSRQALEAEAPPIDIDDDTEGYRAGDVLELFDRVKEKLRNSEKEVHGFMRDVATFKSRDDVRSVRQIVGAALDKVGSRTGDAWVVSDLTGIEFSIRMHIQGTSVDEARVRAAPYAMEIVEEAVVNAVKSVRKQRQQGPARPQLPSGGAIDVTIHVTNELMWIYVLDTGTGLQGKEPLDLAVASEDKSDRDGFRFGLYSVFSLERLNVCSYFLTDTSDGGALARICFPRA